MIQLRRDFYDYFENNNVFDGILNLEGKVFREHKNRETLYFTKDGKGYFVKIHRGVGLKEILKNLFQLKLPILGAQNELKAIKKLEELDIATMKMVGFGVRGIPPAWLDSFIITEELEDTVSLETFCKEWPSNPPAFPLKLAIIRKIASIAQRLHQNGVNHRDFYICHFFMETSQLKKELDYDKLKIYLIDLHRVQIRRKTPNRWVIKDLSGLFFSSMDIGLTRRDIFRFMKAYSGKSLRIIHKEDRLFWIKVSRRAARLYQKHFKHNPHIPGIL